MMNHLSKEPPWDFKISLWPGGVLGRSCGIEFLRKLSIYLFVHSFTPQPSVGHSLWAATILGVGGMVMNETESDLALMVLPI